MRFVTVNKCIKLAIFLGGIGALFILHKSFPNTQQLYPESQQPMPVIRKLKIGADPNGSHDERDTTDSETMSDRLTTMRRSCHKHGLDRPGNDSLHMLNPWEYFINREHRLVWCNVFKSGSSSWMYLFNKMAGYSDQKLKLKRVPPMTLARQKYRRPSKEDLLHALRQKGAISFIVGRHPFERLISGYRDKIVGALAGSLHHKLNRNILMKYRGLSPKDLVQMQSIKKVDRLQRRRRYMSSRSVRPLPPVRRLVPTFKEFVSFILDEVEQGRDLDMHWTPVYSFCNPCQVNFTHLVKFETFDKDSNAIVEAAGLQSYLPRSNGKLSHENPSKLLQGAERTMENYLKELSEEQVRNLTRLYQPDFDIFGYKVPPYELLAGL